MGKLFHSRDTHVRWAKCRQQTRFRAPIAPEAFAGRPSPKTPPAAKATVLTGPKAKSPTLAAAAADGPVKRALRNWQESKQEAKQETVPVPPVGKAATAFALPAAFSAAWKRASTGGSRVAGTPATPAASTPGGAVSPGSVTDCAPHMF